MCTHCTVSWQIKNCIPFAFLNEREGAKYGLPKILQFKHAMHCIFIVLLMNATKQNKCAFLQCLAQVDNKIDFFADPFFCACVRPCGCGCISGFISVIQCKRSKIVSTNWNHEWDAYKIRHKRILLETNELDIAIMYCTNAIVCVLYGVFLVFQLSIELCVAFD